MASSFFLQGPMWVGWTRPKIMTVVKGIERIPLVGLVGELVEGYIPLVDHYFYCEYGRAASASSRDDLGKKADGSRYVLVETKQDVRCHA